jgi:hypothetical protein
LKNRVFILLVFILFFGFAHAQTENCIIKLRKNAPNNILTGLKNNNIKTQNNSLSKIARDYNLSQFSQLFGIFEKTLTKDELEKYGLNRIFSFKIQEKDLPASLSALSLNEFIEYAQKTNKLSVESGEFTPNDPYYGSQYYLNSVNISPVWNTQQNINVIVGIIDSGIDFLHPDLNQSYVINQGEYGNGKENNGIDDDYNGFIDDWRGWNFADNNNSPIDDNIYSHGSCVAGIISAGFNNGTGITPITGSSKSLILKCFNSQGIGYEDQVATAVLYGITRGIKIFNFSFGDYIYSNLLRDVIDYAYSKDITIVCSAGNDNSDVLHYPSAFDEVISVAASDESDRKAAFSSYGNTVDIYAPGVNVLTTSRTGLGAPEFGSNYMYANGTSFSAPIISAIAAVLKEKNPLLSNEEIRGLLISSARYFPSQAGWDYVYASGIANGYSAFQNFNNPSTARIYHPGLNQSFMTSSIPFYLTAASAFFTSYSIGYGIGSTAQSFITLFSSPSQVIRDTVYNWNISQIPDTAISIQLKINTNTGKTIEHRTVIEKNTLIPVITDSYNNEILYNDDYAENISFTTTKPTLGMVYIKRKGVNEPYRMIYTDDGQTGFYSNYHFIYLKHSDFNPLTEYEYYLQAKGLNGLDIIKHDTGFVFITKNKINKTGYIKKIYNLPLSQVCGTIEDILNNGKKTILTNNIQKNLDIEAYNFSGGGFSKISGNWLGNYISRDIILKNGKWNLLTSKQRNGSIFESDQGELPSTNIWNSGSSDDFWSSCFADADNDGTKEILGFGKNGVIIMKNPGTVFAEIPYLPQGKENYANSQNILAGDFDTDGKADLVFTNSYLENNSVYTVLSVYEYIGNNSYQQKFTRTYPLFIKGDNLFKGDFDGNGKQDFGIGMSYADAGIKQFAVLFFTAAGNDNYINFAATDIYSPGSFSDAFSKAGNTDNDAKDEVIINTGGNLYILKYNETSGKFEPGYYSGNYNSYNAVIYDFDNNGTKEIGLNNSDSLVFIERDIPFAGPETPSNVRGHSIDSNRVILNFSAVSGADYYRIYRSDSVTYNLIDSTQSTFFNDNNVQNRRNYYYKLTTVDTNLPVRESRMTERLPVYVHNKSALNGAYFNSGLLFLKYSEKISTIIPSVNSFVINNSTNPKSVGIKSPYEYVLSFSSIPVNGLYPVKSNGLTDFYDSPVDTNTLQFVINIQDSASFYLTGLALINSSTLKAEFNINPDSTTSFNTSNYSFEPFGLKITFVERDKDNRKILYLKINSNNNIGPGGKTYFLRINGIYSENGIRISQGSGSVFSLVFVKENLSDVITYPNPFVRSKSVSMKITFANLTKTAKIYVYDLTGNKVIELAEDNGDGGVDWDVKDDKGRDLPTGIYIFKVEGKNSQGTEVESKLGKFAVVK